MKMPAHNLSLNSSSWDFRFTLNPNQKNLMKTKETSSRSVDHTSFRKVFVAAFALAIPFLASAAQGPQPSICTRSCWAARASSGCGGMSSLTRAIIHHTAGAGDYSSNLTTSKSKVRGVQNIHMDGNGWCDIAYHFLVDAGGNVFEGRSGSMSGLPMGAHDGNNYNSFGFNILGYFHPPYNNDPTDAMLDSLYDVIAWRMPSSWSPYGAGSYNGNTVGYLDGHRKVKSTACPGDGMHPPYITEDYSGGSARDGVESRKNGGGGGGVAPHLAVFCRGADGQEVKYRQVSGLAWGPWISLGGIATSDPSAVSWEPYHMAVFIRGMDSQTIKYRSTAGFTWGNWISIDYPAAGIGGPDACSMGVGQATVFVSQTNGPVWYRATADGGASWAAWTSLGGTTTSDPTGVSWGPNQRMVFIRAANGQEIKYRNGGVGPSSWGAWISIGNPTGGATSAPDALSMAPGQVSLFVRGGDNALWYKSTYDSGATWTAWTTLDGTLTSAPGVASFAPNRRTAFLRGADGAELKYRAWDGSAWGAWVSLGGTLTSGPDACSWSNTAGGR